MEILYIVDVRFLRTLRLMDSQLLNVATIELTWEESFPSEMTALVKNPFTFFFDGIC